jgi:cell division protein FtsW (lipid II flippase)
MGSTLVLISLMLSLSIAVIFPELKYSKSNINVHTDEYDFMVDKQRRGFLILGLLAVVTFLFPSKHFQWVYFYYILLSTSFLVFMHMLHFRLDLRVFNEEIWRL